MFYLQSASSIFFFEPSALFSCSIDIVTIVINENSVCTCRYASAVAICKEDYAKSSYCSVYRVLLWFHPSSTINWTKLATTEKGFSFRLERLPHKVLMVRHLMVLSAGA